jgi:hypothetical protein
MVPIGMFDYECFVDASGEAVTIANKVLTRDGLAARTLTLMTRLQGLGWVDIDHDQP